ncbi:MAG: hypothetical protein IPM54_25805 [Polyangiaceae bacterium]|nr:hypothetical protein [Polyangiaceae bacterium]
MMLRSKTAPACLTAMGLSLALVACGPPEEPETPVTPPGTPPVGAWPGPAQPPQYTPQPYVPPQVNLPPPPTEQECRDRAARAAPIDTSGETDVKQQFNKVFGAHHETFRCCFDALEAPSKPLTNAKVTLAVIVDASGKLTSAEVILAESDPVSMGTIKCIKDIAGMIAYPAPVSGAPAGYKRVFDFKARR